MPHLTRRFWIEAVTGGVCLLLLLVTLFWHDWIELVFGTEPDQGSGALEWTLVLLVACVGVICSALAGLEWRAAHRAPAAQRTGSRG